MAWDDISGDQGMAISVPVSGVQAGDWNASIKFWGFDHHPGGSPEGVYEIRAYAASSSALTGDGKPDGNQVGASSETGRVENVMEWYDWTTVDTPVVSLSAAEAAQVTHFIINVRSQGKNHAYYGMDDVTVTYTPEPATMSLLGLGGLALLRRRRK